MTPDKVVWTGKGPIHYQITIFENKNSASNQCYSPMDCWRYIMEISGFGKYEEAILGSESEALSYLADTKEGILRDLEAFLADQIDDKETRKGLGLPPKPLNPDNVIIIDDTLDNEFKDINLIKLYQVAKNIKGMDDIPPRPKGEKPFILTIEEEDPTEDTYCIYLDYLDTPIAEDIANPNCSTSLSYAPDTKGNEVIKTARDILNDHDKNYTDIGPSIEFSDIKNTKILNITNNPEFTLGRIFGVTQPLKLTNRIKQPSLNLTRKTTITAPVQQLPIKPKETNLTPDVIDKKRLRLKA